MMYLSTPPDAEPAGPVSAAPSETVRCDDYAAHQFGHRRDGAGWVCDVCRADPLIDDQPVQGARRSRSATRPNASRNSPSQGMER